MLKKGMALISLVGLALFANLFFMATSIQALEINDNGCFTFNDRQPICPDKYCLPGTASCSNDGNRCYCKTRTLTNSNQNQSCEIIFGSKMIYKTENGSHTIYLYGGLWSQMASLVTNSQHVKTINGEPAIVFKRAYGKIYRTSFLTDLYKSTIVSDAINKAFDSGMVPDIPIATQDIMIAIEVDIDSRTGVGYVSNPRYEIGDSRFSPFDSSNNVSCSHQQSGNQPFFLKYSVLDSKPYDEDNPHNVCVFPSYIMSMVVFGRNDKSWFPTPPKVPLTKNCTDKRDTFFSKDNLDIHLLMANLITPQGEKRKIYLMRPENFLLGEIFDGSDHPLKVTRIRQFCQESDVCKGYNPSPDCRLCDSKLLNRLDNNSGKSLNQLLQEFLTKEDQTVCDLINTGVESMSNDGYDGGSNTGIAGLDADAANGNFKSDQEAKLDKQLPKGIINLCDKNQNNQAQRIKCKNFALKCYINNLPEIEPVSMCDQLNGPLTSSRWMICSASNMLSSASSRSGKFLDSFFRLNSSDFFQNQTFVKTWTTFKNISNVLLILVMMWIVISQVTSYGLSNYHIKKMLPKLIVAIILINLSMLLAQIAVDLSNLAGRGLFLLFDNFAKTLRISGLAKINFSTIVLSSLTSSGLFLVLGGLILVLPILIVIIVGLLFVAILLSLRHSLVVILILSMPFAIIAGTLANTQRLFQIWSKNFFNVLIIYPVIGLMFGAGNFVKLLLISVSRNDNNLQLIALAMPFLLTAATPFVMLLITKGIGALNAFMQNSMSWSLSTSQRSARNSDFNQAIKANQERFWLRSSIFDRALSNKTLNQVFLGAGDTALRRRIQKRASIQNLYKDIIGSDTKLLNAFHTSQGELSGSLYNGLNENQQQRYRQLASLGVLKDKGFYETSFTTLAAKGGLSEDCAEINNILNNAQKHKVESASLNASLFMASKIAEKSGNPFTSGVMAYASRSYQTASSTTPTSKSPAIKLDFTSTQAQNEIIIETDKALNKILPSRFNDNDFFHKTTDPATGGRKPTPALKAVISRITDNPPISNNQADLKSHYVSVIGSNYPLIPLAIRSEIDQQIINTIQTGLTYNSGLPVGFVTAEEALIAADLLTRSIGGNTR